MALAACVVIAAGAACSSDDAGGSVDDELGATSTSGTDGPSTVDPPATVPMTTVPPTTAAGSPPATTAAPATTVPAVTSTSDPDREPIDFVPGEPTGVVGSVDDVEFLVVPDCGDVPGGGADVVVPATADPGPVVFAFHGGGFIGGERANIWERGTEEGRTAFRLLDAGITVISVDYPLLGQPSGSRPDGVLGSLMGARDCVAQLLRGDPGGRYDPGRVAFYGGSAGAGIALWLGTSDDAGVEHAAAVAVIAPQATYDLSRWRTDVFAEFGPDADDALASTDAVAAAFYGVDDVDEATDVREAVDLLALLDATDPPLWIGNTSRSAEVPVALGELYHHPFQARLLGETAIAAGVETQLYVSVLDIADPCDEPASTFLIRHLTSPTTPCPT